MNKWSRSLPSINALTDETAFNAKPLRLPQRKLLPSIKILTNDAKVNGNLQRSPLAQVQAQAAAAAATANDDSDSLTDVSMISPTKPSPVNYEQKCKVYNVPNQYDSVIEIDAMTHNEFVPVDQLYDSLFAYANSFRLDDLIYPAGDAKESVESALTLKQRSEPSTQRPPIIPETNNLVRHKSCEDVVQAAQPPSHERKPARVFSQKKIDHDDNDNQSDESTTVTDGSKFQWEHFSESVDHVNKSSINVNNNFHLSAAQKPAHMYASQEFEHRTSTKSAPKVLHSPIIIRERTQDPHSQQHVEARPLRSSSPPLRTTPIIVREIVHRPSPSEQLIAKHPSPPATISNYPEYNRSSKPPIVPKSRTGAQPERDIHHREEMQRANAEQYRQQHNASLYSNEVFHDILTNVI